MQRHALRVFKKMKKVLLEMEGETKELYLGSDDGLYQEDPDPKMLGYSRVMWLSDAKKKGYVVIPVHE